MSRTAALPLGYAVPEASISARDRLRRDLRVIADMIEPSARVLDVGCGDGALLHYLVSQKGADARGVELSQSGVNACVTQGLSVIQGDADSDLDAYPTGAFDVVVLSQTLQATRQPRRVLETLMRIGKRAIVSFPNFGFWRVRAGLALRGRMPVTGLLDNQWYDSPNIHLCTIRDFVALCDEIDVRIEKSVTLDRYGRPFTLNPSGSLANLLSEQGVFVLTRGAG
jgi:methionine biosynthesis protein MetW